jgi:hypothetical protein
MQRNLRTEIRSKMGEMGMTKDPRNPGIHCDGRILHAPNMCIYCDEYGAEAQQERINQGINFTGEYDKNKEGCPSELWRPLEIIEKWPRNRAYPHGENDELS